MTTYTIGEVAERSGFATTTLRFYEDRGILEPAGRTDAGYRLYDEQSLDRLAFVAQAKRLGCTLDEITDLAGLWERDDCAPVQRRLHQLVTDKIAEVRTQQETLATFEAELRRAATTLGSEPTDGPCAPGCACLAEPAVDDVTCTLPADQQLGRVDEWQDLLAGARTRDERRDGSVRYEFDDVSTAGPLASLAAAESGCCAFFDFTVAITDGAVVFEVGAPTSRASADIQSVVFGQTDSACGCC